jgi:hypothetical protein
MRRAQSVGTFLTLLLTGLSLGCTVEPAGSDPTGSGGISQNGMAVSGISMPVGGGSAAVIPGGGAPGMAGEVGGSGPMGIQAA